MKQRLLKALTIAMVLTLSTGYFATAKSTAADPKQFKDVPTTHWAYNFIMEGVSKGYISGDSNGTFRPNDPVKVNEFIKMLEMTLTEKDASGFVWWSDKTMDKVPDWNAIVMNSAVTSFDQGKPWYINYVTTAQNLGLIGDEYVGRYDDPLTRERAAKIIYNLDRFLNGTIQRDYAMIAGPQLFKDFGKADKYYQEYIGDVAIHGIMSGNNGGYFLPKSTITRAEASKICVMLVDTSQRSKVNINTSSASVSNVPQPGYDDMTFVFDNDEMKKIYDALYAHQKNYTGVTNAYLGQLNYYADEAASDESFRSHFYIGYDFESENQSDLVIDFNENVYNATVSPNLDRYMRAKSEVEYFLSLVFSDKSNQAAVLSDISKAVSDAQNSKAVKVSKVVENRQVNLSNTVNYIHIAISGYKDKN